MRARRGRRRTPQILIAEPAALKMLDGQNIVITSGPRSIQFLKGAQWADRLPLVVQAQARRGVPDARAASAASATPGEGLAIDYQVVADIRAFQVGVGGGEPANVEMYVRLLNDRNGVVRAEGIQRHRACAGEGNAGYVRALDAAFGQVGRRDRRLDGQDHLSRAPRMARDHKRKAAFKRLGLRPSTSSGLRTSTSISRLMEGGFCVSRLKAEETGCR